MRIQSIQLQNFKRFTDLKIEGIRESAKLVLLIGANGSGKSSVFDALNLYGNERAFPNSSYFCKDVESAYKIEIVTALDAGSLTSGGRPEIWNRVGGTTDVFFGRSSLRVIPVVERINNPEEKIKGNDDRPATFTSEDRRFNADLAAFTTRIDKALREPTFQGKAADTLAIFREHIEPFNMALKRVFGGGEETTIQIQNYDNSDPGKPIQLFLKKALRASTLIFLATAKNKSSSF